MTIIKKNHRILLHPKPDVDCFFGTALFKKFGQINITGYMFGREKNLKDIDVICIDTGEEDFDHHGQAGETSTSLVAKALQLENEKWLQRILKFVERVDLEGRSWPFDIADIQKSMIKDTTLSDDEITEIGVKMAENIIEFSKEKLRRNNLFLMELIQKFLAEKKVRPERFIIFLNQLSKEQFERPLDLVEIITAEKELKNEASAKKFTQIILEILFKDWQNYQNALEEVEKSEKIRVHNYSIIIGQTDNPKFGIAARAEGGHVIIQKNTKGNIQIFFDRKTINKKIADKIIVNLRKLEMLLNDKQLSNEDLLIKEGKLENWYYFVGKEGKEMQNFCIFNGSLTAPEVLPTVIPIQKIIDIVKEALQS